MATENTPKTEKETYVDLFVPRGYGNDDPNEFISINGKNFLLPKGKTSKVPKYVKEEFERSQKAQEAFLRKSEALIEKAQQPL
jgi:predicted aconitase with swiveling domain